MMVGFLDNQVKEKVIRTPERTTLMCRNRTEHTCIRSVHTQGEIQVWCLGELTGLRILT